MKTLIVDEREFKFIDKVSADFIFIKYSWDNTDWLFCEKDLSGRFGVGWIQYNRAIKLINEYFMDLKSRRAFRRIPGIGL